MLYISTIRNKRSLDTKRTYETKHDDVYWSCRSCYYYKVIKLVFFVVSETLTIICEWVTPYFVSLTAASNLGHLAIAATGEITIMEKICIVVSDYCSLV